MSLSTITQGDMNSATVWIDCEDCQSNNGIQCPDIRRLDSCCGDNSQPWRAYVPTTISSGTIRGADGLCYTIGAIDLGLVNVINQSYNPSTECDECLQVTPCPTKTPTPTPTISATPTPTNLNT